MFKINPIKFIKIKYTFTQAKPKSFFNVESWIIPTISREKVNPKFYKDVVNPKAVPKYFYSTAWGIDPQIAEAYIAKPIPTKISYNISL